MPHNDRARFRAPNAALTELRRNFPNLSQTVRDTLSALSPVVNPFGAGLRRGIEIGQQTELPSMESNALGFPQSSVREMARVREQLNPDYSGIITNALPQAAEAVETAGGNLARAATGEPIQPLEQAPPVAQPSVGFDDFGAANQGIGLRGETTLTGPRIIRRPGETPLLTNLTGAELGAGLAEGREFVTSPTTGRTLVVNPDTGEIEGRSGFAEAPVVSPVGGGIRGRAAATGGQPGVEAPRQGGLRPGVFEIGDTFRPRGVGGITAFLLGQKLDRAEQAQEERNREFERSQQELGLRGRQVAAQETQAGAAGLRAQVEAARALQGEQPSIADRLRALGDIERRTNPVSGTTDLIVGAVSIPQSQIPVFENFAASFRQDPDFVAEHGGKTLAEQDRIAARLATELMIQQGLIATGEVPSAAAELEQAFGGA